MSKTNIQWSKSWVYNLFRCFEFVFGRPKEIRRECVAIFNDREVVYQFFTLESFLCHIEGEIRAWIKIPKWRKVEVWSPIFATNNQSARLPMPQLGYWFAIARDNSTNYNPGTVASGSTVVSYAVSGLNPFLCHSVRDNTNNTDDITSATYAGVAETQGQKFDLGVTAAFAYMYYLQNPTTGTNNLVLNYTNSPKSYVGVVASYSGVSRGALDNTNFTSDSTGLNNTHSITPSASNCWAVLIEVNIDGNPIAGTGANLVVSAQQSGVFDSNGAITAGSPYSMTVTVTASTRSAMWSMFTIAPTGGVTGVFKTLLGVGLS